MPKIILEKAVKFVDDLLICYYEQQDAQGISVMVEEDIIWCETEGDKLFRGKKQILDNIINNGNIADKAVMIQNQDKYEAKEISENTYLVFGKIMTSIGSNGIQDRKQEIMIMVICRISDNQCRASFVNLLFPTRELESYIKELQDMTTYVPGAMFCCMFDEALSIVRMSDSFLELTGYTREEIKEYFHDSFWEMIDPKKREQLYDEVKEQIVRGDTKEIEYHLLCKGHTKKWVLDKRRLIRTDSGEEMFYCVLVDITAGKQAQEELELSLERHQIIMDQTTDIVFEWNILKDKMVCSSNWGKRFTNRPLVDKFSENIENGANIYKDDCPIFSNALEDIRRGNPYVQVEVRMEIEEKTYRWFRIRMTAQFNKEGVPIKAVGVIIDIDEQKKNSQKLYEEAKRDTLTNLYNKGTAKSLVEDYLKVSKDCRGALLIIDVDDFKMVNDTMGHLFGDAFLMEITSGMKKLFRESDVVGRIGGDEFIVFIKDIFDINVASQKAEEIVDTFKQVKIQESWERRVSCSIGISLYPLHGKSFEELYKRADFALYDAKKQGKSKYVMFDEESDANLLNMPFNPRTAINEVIDSNEETGESLNNKLVEYIFRILYKSINVEAAVQGILEIVGRQFDVSRAYIFENTEDDIYCSNTFEWCNSGILPQKENLKLVEYREIGGNYLKNFNEDGIFYCKDILALPKAQREILQPQGIKSMLQCAIKDNGEFKGYVGFDECRVNRFWTKEQVSILTFISEILSTFLLKQRAQERTRQTAESMRTLLDNQDSWIYVIDLETYEMYFINQKTKNLVKHAEEGMKCYEAFFGRKEPCDKCPARKLRDDMKNFSMEIYNPVLNVWSLADASKISWKGKEAVLLSCHDITRYKIKE